MLDFKWFRNLWPKPGQRIVVRKIVYFEKSEESVTFCLSMPFCLRRQTIVKIEFEGVINSKYIGWRWIKIEGVKPLHGEFPSFFPDTLEVTLEVPR